MSSTFKVITSIILLIVIIIAVSLYSMNSLAESSEKLEKYIVNIEKNTKEGNWEKAKKEIESIQKDWEKTEKLWTVLLDHIEIDNIDEAISKMSMYVELENAPLALGEATTLRQYIKHIPEKESFSIKNIL